MSVPISAHFKQNFRTILCICVFRSGPSAAHIVIGYASRHALATMENLRRIGEQVERFLEISTYRREQ